jgi:predicted RNase H-like HicB family nuclease
MGGGRKSGGQRTEIRGRRGKFFYRITVLVARIVLGYSDNMTLKVFIHSAEEGGFWAEVPALPGCVSQGETMDELRSNVREAIEGWLLAEDDAAKSPVFSGRFYMARAG